MFLLCTAGTGVRFFWKSQNSDFWGQTDQKKVCFSWKSQNSRENVVNSAKIPLVMSLQFGDCDDRYFHLNCIYVQSQIFCPKNPHIGQKKVWFYQRNRSEKSLIFNNFSQINIVPAVEATSRIEASSQTKAESWIESASWFMAAYWGSLRNWGWFTYCLHHYLSLSHRMRLPHSWIYLPCNHIYQRLYS